MLTIDEIGAVLTRMELAFSRLVIDSSSAGVVNVQFAFSNLQIANNNMKSQAMEIDAEMTRTLRKRKLSDLRLSDDEYRGRKRKKTEQEMLSHGYEDQSKVLLASKKHCKQRRRSLPDPGGISKRATLITNNFRHPHLSAPTTSPVSLVSFCIEPQTPNRSIRQQTTQNDHTDQNVPFNPTDHHANLVFAFPPGLHQPSEFLATSIKTCHAPRSRRVSTIRVHEAQKRLDYGLDFRGCPFTQGERGGRPV
ncbi:hypothetical protein BKA81DRAFT_378926 [Phyllosticta paracitricarpa]